jgi:transcriptional regulator with XRE-family HTH domain
VDSIRKNIVGDRVRRLRAAACLSQDALATLCQVAGWDLTRGTLAKIESGIRRVNDAEVVVLASILKSPVGIILDGVGLEEALNVVRHGREGGGSFE